MQPVPVSQPDPSKGARTLYHFGTTGGRGRLPVKRSDTKYHERHPSLAALTAPNEVINAARQQQNRRSAIRRRMKERGGSAFGTVVPKSAL